MQYTGAHLQGHHELHVYKDRIKTGLLRTSPHDLYSLDTNVSAKQLLQCVELRLQLFLLHRRTVLRANTELAHIPPAQIAPVGIKNKHTLAYKQTSAPKAAAVPEPSSVTHANPHYGKPTEI